jgi:hypothetical protein
MIGYFKSNIYLEVCQEVVQRYIAIGYSESNVLADSHYRPQ